MGGFVPACRALMDSYEGYGTAEEFGTGYDNFITPEVVAQWDQIFRRASETTRRRLELRPLRYGPKGRNGIDFFPAQVESAAPVLVAIHGGLWFLFDKWFMHFLAEAFTRAGVHVACINYGLAPGQGLGGIVDDARRAVAYLWREAEALGIDRSRISALGHSAAGQIVTMVAATPWAAYVEDGPEQILHGCIGVSGFYDIEPFAQTHFHAMTQFPAEEYRAWNPMRHASAHFPRTLLITGAKESSLLQQMMAHFAEALRKEDVPVETICAEGEDHFSVLHEIGNPDSELFARVLEMVG
jgi:arylformamidase